MDKKKCEKICGGKTYISAEQIYKQMNKTKTNKKG